MRSALAASLFVLVAVSGCIDDASPAGTDSGPDTVQVRAYIETWNDASS